MRGIWQEFRTFVARGSVFDLAVGIVIGAAFSTVVNSFVKDILMPPLGMLTGSVDFSELYIDLSGGDYASLARATEAGAPTLNYGIFLNNVIVFLIVSWVLFLVVRSYNRLKEKEAGPPAAPTEQECPFCRYRVPIGARRCAHCTSELEPTG